ncbi:MAG: hypothetical protein K6E67_10470 [Prevotella sp.]|nr:hypothetical protein [Prevotella sp.]
MDRLLRAEIVATVRETMQEVMEGAEEVYLTPEQLAERISFLPLEWIRRNGELLPREYAVVNVGGKEIATRFGYPYHKINRMIKEGKLKCLRKEA